MPCINYCTCLILYSLHDLRTVSRGSRAAATKLAMTDIIRTPNVDPDITITCDICTIVWFFRAPRWYIGPTAMPRAAVTPIAPERSEGAIGCDSRPRHCRRDDIPAWRPNKITLLSLLPLDLTMYHRFISFLCAVQSREGVSLTPDTVCKSRLVGWLVIEVEYLYSAYRKV